MLLTLALGLVFAIQTGQKAPEFKLADLKGNPVTMENLKGQPAVITLWASWCSVCKAELPKLHKLAQEVKVPFYAISREPRDSIKVVGDYMKNLPTLSPLVALEGGDTPVQVVERWKVTGQPWTFVLNPEGKLVNFYAGRAEIAALKDDLVLAGYR
jgi:thiol-disulfide isomerase/thioredoxin